MKSREKMLAIAVGAVVVLFGLKWGYDLVADMFQSREAAITDRTSRQEKDEGTVRAGDLAEKRMKVWQARSLPTNTEKGRADYQHWLTSVADKHLKNASVTRENTISDQGAEPRGGVAAGKDKDKPLDERYRFHIKAVDSDLKMTGVVKFLYDFYTANHLQTIRNLSLTPDKDKLVVSIDVEGMMLPAAERKDVMLKDPLSQLAKGDFRAYRESDQQTRSVCERRVCCGSGTAGRATLARHQRLPSTSPSTPRLPRSSHITMSRKSMSPGRRATTAV